jgi:hypothetical protein
MLAYIAMFAVCILLVIITILLLTGRGSFLIAGYNTLPGETKDKYDQPALCRFVGKVLIPFDVLMIAIAVGAVTHAPWTGVAGIIGGIGCLPYLIAMAVYANTGNRFQK